ncbi:MAG: hypothetical protein QW328_09950 [Nitrososphaerota archaeon]
MSVIVKSKLNEVHPVSQHASHVKPSQQRLRKNCSSLLKGNTGIYKHSVKHECFHAKRLIFVEDVVLKRVRKQVIYASLLVAFGRIVSTNA